MAATESKPWWSPIIITVVGILLIVTPAWQWLPAWPLNILNVATGLFLILIVLIQRGKGGGLAGAFGGTGGSSPFGSRAGDQFTRFTITVATFWLWVILLQVKVIHEGARLATAEKAARAQKG
jgi:preprotein translocase subunit SecG